MYITIWKRKSDAISVALCYIVTTIIECNQSQTVNQYINKWVVTVHVIHQHLHDFSLFYGTFYFQCVLYILTTENEAVMLFDVYIYNT